MSNSKKIAITSYNHPSVIGGVESYVRSLSKVFQENGYQVEIIVMEKQGKDYPSTYEGAKIIMANKISFNFYQPVRLIEKLLLDPNYEAVINNVVISSRKMIKSKKLVQVQHFPTDQYGIKRKTKSDTFKSYLEWIFLRIWIKGNILEKSKNVVLFTEFEDVNSNNKKWYIQTPINFESIKVSKQLISNREKFIWIGRFGDAHKNIKGAVELVNKGIDIDFYGAGPDGYLIPKENNKGILSFDKKLETINKYKALVLTSHFEGMPIVINEALACGLSVFTTKCFKSIEFYEGNEFFKSFTSVDKDMYESIKNFDENFKDIGYKVSKESQDFYKDNLSWEKFNKNWINVINDLKNSK